MSSPSSDISNKSISPSLPTGMASPPSAEPLTVSFRGRTVTYTPQRDNSAVIEHEGKRYILSGEKIADINKLEGASQMEAAEKLGDIIGNLKMKLGEDLKNVKVYNTGHYKSEASDGSEIKGRSDHIKENIKQLDQVIMKAAQDILLPNRGTSRRSNESMSISSFSNSGLERPQHLKLNDSEKDVCALFLSRASPKNYAPVNSLMQTIDPKGKRFSTVAARVKNYTSMDSVSNMNQLKMAILTLSALDKLRQKVAEGYKPGEEKDQYLAAMDELMVSLEGKIAEFLRIHENEVKAEIGKPPETLQAVRPREPSPPSVSVSMSVKSRPETPTSPTRESSRSKEA